MIFPLQKFHVNKSFLEMLKDVFEKYCSTFEFQVAKRNGIIDSMLYSI